MTKRGRILSDPTAGPGRVMVQGRQHLFGLDGAWKSDALPRPGIVVDVEFDDAGAVSAVSAVPEARLAREQAAAAVADALAKARGTKFGVVPAMPLLAVAVLAILAAIGLGTVGAVAVAAGYLVLVCIRRFLVARACDTAAFDENE